MLPRVPCSFSLDADRAPQLKTSVMPHPIASISPQLKRMSAALCGSWVRRWERYLWEGTVSSQEEFVLLIMVRLADEIFWAKSLPSKNKSLTLRFDLYPTSKTEPQVQFHFSVGSGAFLQNVTATLVDREYRPPVLAPGEIETGVVILFASFPPNLEFSFACFAKSDVIVRRNYVWGLKSPFLDSLESPWRDILAKGRSGVVPWRAAA